MPAKRTPSCCWTVLSSALAAAAVTLTPSPAKAECGVFTADEGDNQIYYGRRARILTQVCPLNGVDFYSVVPDVVDVAVVCWQDRFGTWRYEEFPGCNRSTPASEELLIFGGDGDDIIAPVVHLRENAEFVCRIPGTSGSLSPSFPSTPPSPVLLEWYEREASRSERSAAGCTEDAGCPYHSMGVGVFGGPGADEIHGTPADDSLYSSDGFGPSYCWGHNGAGSGDSSVDACVCAIDSTCCTDAWTWTCVNTATSSCAIDCSNLTAFEEDGEVDTLCGHGGDDRVVGDEDYGPDAYELLSGGPGEDLCRGIWPPGSTGDCCNASSSPGCVENSAIEAAVCAADSFCCANAWDTLCVDQVISVAGGSCPPPPGTPACCAESTGPGCGDDATIEAAVCADDPFCCDTAWDGLCVTQVETVAGASCERLTDYATTSCETSFEVINSDTGPAAPAYAVCGDATAESLPPDRYPTTSSNVISDSQAAFAEECFLPFPGGGGIPGIPGGDLPNSIPELPELPMPG